MEFQDVIRRRRMVRHYDTDRPVPPDVVDRILQNGLRAPSAGFSQGWAFLVLDDPAGVARFRAAAEVLHRGQWGQPFSAS
ncbi:MAG TPA: nitroreductase family protein [Streptosporangiaceae bacterium]